MIEDKDLAIIIINRIKLFAEQKNLKVAPEVLDAINHNDYQSSTLIKGLIKNFRSFGEFLCPCYTKIKYKKGFMANRPYICPCSFLFRDLKEKGSCHCNLFFL